MSKYAQLVEGALIPAPTQIIKDEYIIKNPNKKVLEELGYKPLKYDKVPEITVEGNRLKEVYTDQGDYIQVSYQEYTPDPEPILPEPVSDNEIREVLALSKMAINTIELTDTQSLEVKSLYPNWEEFIGQELPSGFKFIYNDKLYKTKSKVKPVTESQPPSIDTDSIYEEIDEINAKTKVK